MPLTPLHNSVIFKKLFRDPEVLHEFIRDVTGVDLDIRPEYIETEKRFSPPVGPIDIVMDVVVEDPTHRVLIEIQRERYDYHYERFLHYHQVATVELASTYRDYRLDRTVYTIVWLTARSRNPIFQHSLITTSFCSITDTGQQLDLYPHKLFFLNPFYRNDQTPAGLTDWLQLVVESITNPQQPVLNYDRGVISRAAQLIANDNITPDERRLLFEETGFENHLLIREEQGRAEGRAEGQAEGKRAVARNMLAMGIDRTLVAQSTGLSREELETL